MSRGWTVFAMVLGGWWIVMGVIPLIVGDGDRRGLSIVSVVLGITTVILFGVLYWRTRPRAEHDIPPDDAQP